MLRLLPWIMLNSMLKNSRRVRSWSLPVTLLNTELELQYGEPTQGAGAVAMLISHNPRILSFNDDNVAQTRDVMDFWRPNYATTPFVNGIYSTQQYLDSLKTTWAEYQKRTGLA